MLELVVIICPWAVQGISYVPPFGISVLIVAPFVTALPYLITTREWPNFHFNVAALPGVASGIIWNIGKIGVQESILVHPLVAGRSVLQSQLSS